MLKYKSFIFSYFVFFFNIYENLLLSQWAEFVFYLISFLIKSKIFQWLNKPLPYEHEHRVVWRLKEINLKHVTKGLDDI